MDFDKTFAVYLGQNESEHAVGFVVEDNFFCVLEINLPDAENQLRLTTESIREVLKNKLITANNDLKNLSNDLIQKHQLASFTIGYFNQNQLFTYAHQGAVILLRQKQLYIASKEKTVLVGRYESLDNYLFCSHALLSLITNKSSLRLNDKHPKEVVEEIKKNNPSGQGALLVVQAQLSQDQETTEYKSPVAFAETDQDLNQPQPPISTNYSLLLAKLVNLLKQRWLKKALISIALLLILASILLALSRSLEKQREQAFIEKFSVLNEKFKQLEKDLQSDPSQTIKQIENLQLQVDQLIEDYPVQENKISQLDQKINELQKIYGNAQITEETLFFDLSLIDKKATADYLEVTNEYLSLLDNQNKKAYLINIRSKNVNEVLYHRFNKAQLITEYNKNLYLFDQATGVYKDSDGQFLKIINKDKDWGNIIDLDIFNSNIYLLSRDRDEIYKFTPAEGGYSSKLSYFQSGNSLDLDKAKNMSIDFSIYLLGQQIYKYTAGAQDNFKVLPQLEYSTFKRLYKNSQTDYLYILDSNNGRIIALNEDGKLIKSIFNPKLKECQYFGVYQDEMIIFLRQNKLYKLDNF